MLTTSGNDGLVRIWETTTGREVYTLRGRTGRTLAGAFSPDGTTIYTTGLDRAIFSWDLVGRNTLEHAVRARSAHRHLRRELRRHERRVGRSHRSLRHHAAVAGEVAVGRSRRRDRLRPAAFITILPSGGTTVVVGTDDWTLSRWDVATGSLLATTQEESDLYPLAVSHDQSTVFVQVGLDTIQALDRDHARTPRRRARRGRRDRCRSHLRRR